MALAGKGLIGLHDETALRMSQRILAKETPQIDTTSTLDGILEFLRPYSSGQVSVGDRVYGWVLMDVNLGERGANIYAPGSAVYDILKPHVESGNLNFLALSANNPLVTAARKAGIPTLEKPVSNLGDLLTTPEVYKRFLDSFRNG